jgi:hypothetical protein
MWNVGGRVDIVEGIQKVMRRGEKRMDPKEHSRRRTERYIRRVELRRESKKEAKKKING